MLRKIRKYFRDLTHNQDGSVNIAGTIILGLAMIFVGIGFTFLVISTDATTTLLAYEYSSNTSITDASFTGYTQILGVTPLLILVGFLTAAVISGMMGIKIMKGAAAYSAGPGSLLLVGLSLVFVGIGLIIEPIALNGISAVVHGGGSGISSTFVGYEALVLISPTLVHLGFLTAAVLSGFFGLKGLARAA